MSQYSLSNKNKTIRVKNCIDISEIHEALYLILYVPNERLKPFIIQKLIEYLKPRLNNEEYKLKVFITTQNEEINGFIISQILPNYSSYGRKCGTFGWLHAYDFETCKELIKQCENHMRENKIRKLRGNINFPKGLGGVGIQFFGFEEQMMFGVAFNNPSSNILSYLEELGYIKESEYTCMKVTKKSWDSGKIMDKNIRLGYVTLNELEEMIEDIQILAEKSFHSIMPDRSGFYERMKEMYDTYSQVPKSHYKLPKDFQPRKYSSVPEFVEAWESCNLEEVNTWCPLAFDRKTGSLVGIILSLPDLYELWLEQPITRNNVDTVMVDRNYSGKGIFSALNNIGQLTCNLNGVNYFEGTSIWSNNKDAINSIFPHCEHIRKFFVVQKRIK